MIKKKKQHKIFVRLLLYSLISNNSHVTWLELKSCK